MSGPARIRDTINSLHTIIRELDGKYVGRREAARLLTLAVVCREHMLLLGPPGTAKTTLITEFAGLIQAKPFSYLLTRFTEPTEIFGPLDFDLFRKGTYQIKTEEMMPAAEIVFLDEIFQGSSAILNTLLTLINERRFYNGSRPVDAPLVSMFGAAAELPDDTALRAFGDRFLLRLEIEPVGRTRLPELLERGWEQETARIGGNGVSPLPKIELADLTRLSRAVNDVRLDGVRGVYADLIGELLAQGVRLSDRRIVRGQKLIAAAALLRHADAAAPKDLWPLAHLWTEPGDAEPVKQAVRERVAADGGDALEPARSVAELLALARHQAARVLDRPGAPTKAAVIAALRGINELLGELRERHPRQTAAREELRGLIHRVSALLEEEEDGDTDV